MNLISSATKLSFKLKLLSHLTSHNYKWNLWTSSKDLQTEKKSPSPYLPTTNQSRWDEKIKLPDFTSKRCLGILVNAEVTKLSLNSWFKLTVTKVNLSTNSLMTFIFFLIKLNSEVPMMSVLCKTQPLLYPYFVCRAR